MSQHNIGRIFLSTPSARRATIDEYKAHKKAEISIHALREEGDREIQTDRAWRANFYPRPPRGGRPNPPVWVELISGFLSTPSARRATSQVEMARRINKDFYPRPPRGGRRETFWGRLRRRVFLSTPSARRATVAVHRGNAVGVISIHALREEGDIDVHVTVIHDRISIHALREEGDRSWSTLTRCPSNFYPRPPRGGRLSSCRLSGVQS